VPIFVFYVELFYVFGAIFYVKFLKMEARPNGTSHFLYGSFYIVWHVTRCETVLEV